MGQVLIIGGSIFYAFNNDNDIENTYLQTPMFDEDTKLYGLPIDTSF